MYDWSVLSLSLHLRLSCTGKWLFEASPGNPQSELVHMPHGLHFNLDHPNYIQIWCKSTLSSSFDAVRESETEAAPWPVISIIIGSPWKYPSSCGILVHMNEMRYFFPFPSQSLPLSVVFLSLLTQTFFFFKPQVWKTFKFLYRSKFTCTFKHTYPYFMSLSGANSQCKGGPG